MKKGLYALALGTFTLGMAEFIIEGILTDVSHDMDVSIPQVGHLISIYALGVCAGAFSLILMHKYRPKNILMFLASLITIGATIASVAPNFGLLLCARFIQGLPHGAYFGTGTIVAVKIAQKGKGTSAVAMMCAGMPFANLIGVPIGTFLSHNVSWRAPFFISIFLGLLTLYMIYRWVPNVEALPNNGMKAQFHFLRNKAPWLIIAATILRKRRYAQLVQLYIATASSRRRIQRSKHISTHGVSRFGHGDRQLDQRSAIRSIQTRTRHQWLSDVCRHCIAAHLLLRFVRLGCCYADVCCLYQPLRCRFTRAIPHSETFRRRRNARRVLHTSGFQLGQCLGRIAWRHTSFVRNGIQLPCSYRHTSGSCRSHLPMDVPPTIRINNNEEGSSDVCRMSLFLF